MHEQPSRILSGNGDRNLIAKALASLPPTSPTPRNYLVSLGLFAATFFTATWGYSLFFGDPELLEFLETAEEFSWGFFFTHPALWRSGLLYAITIMPILLAHELGHYTMCRRYGVRCTLPYFLPAPTFFGTFGAFIRIKSPITDRKALFDIGFAGPAASFLLSFPALLIGLRYSEAVVPPPLESEGFLWFGEPLLFKATSWLILDIPPGHDIILHPIAFAGWFGLLITGLNLFPIGQLDGGHIAYSLFGRKSVPIAKVAFLGVLLLIFYFPGWIIWGALMLILGFRHPPPLNDQLRLDRRRKFLVVCALIIFLTSFIPIPISTADMWSVSQLWGAP